MKNNDVSDNGAGAEGAGVGVLACRYGVRPAGWRQGPLVWRVRTAAEKLLELEGEVAQGRVVVAGLMERGERGRAAEWRGRLEWSAGLLAALRGEFYGKMGRAGV